MLNKTQQKRVINLVKSLLCARRNGKLRQEQSAYERLDTACRQLGIDPADAMDQGIAWLKRNSIAASMNGWV
jgi:hypothetical protein